MGSRTRKARCPKCCPDVAIGGWKWHGSTWECHNCGYEVAIQKRARKRIDAHGVQMTPEQKMSVDAMLAAANDKPYILRRYSCIPIAGTILLQVVIGEHNCMTLFDNAVMVAIGERGTITVDLCTNRRVVIKPWQIVVVESMHKEARRQVKAEDAARAARAEKKANRPKSPRPSRP